MEIKFLVKNQPWFRVMSSTSEHIHREKLDMHAGQFFLGMKFTQNAVHKFNKSERRRFDGVLIRPYIYGTDQVRPDGSKGRQKTP